MDTQEMPFYFEERSMQVITNCLNDLNIKEMAYKTIGHLCIMNIQEYVNMVKSLAEQQNNGCVLDELQFAGLIY
jgi:hypothetical protein